MLLVENDGIVSLSNGTESAIISSSWLTRKYNYPVLSQERERRIYKTNEMHFIANSAEEFPQTELNWGLVESWNLPKLRQEYMDFLNGKEKEPKWKQFRMFFLQNIAYNRMRFNTSLVPGQIAAERVEAFLNKESSEWKVLAGQWDVFIDYAPASSRANAEEIAEWNTQAISASMPFKFKNDAKMTLLS